MFNLNKLLESLHTTNQVNVQMGLFSTLSAYLMSNDTEIDLIVTHNSLYDKICYVLSNCPPKKAIVMFNFLSALIYAVDDEDSRRKQLSVYAKNMIRSSGCLATMCELFTSYMMHQDVWRSLCQCLAETCRDVEPNQSYCTHLIPMCIQRCSQSNIEVFLVLQSLLQNHKRNICLFVECNGIALFQRDFLQHDLCLQLLNTLVQNSTQAARLLTGSDVSGCLRDFLHLYGPQSQLGQWATVILYYISNPKDSIEVPATENKVNDTRPVEDSINKSVLVNPDLQCTTDTTRFFQNVMREIFQYNHKELNKHKRKPFNMLLHKSNTTQQNFCYQENNIAHILGGRNTKTNDLLSSIIQTSTAQQNFHYPQNRIASNMDDRRSNKINQTDTAQQIFNCSKNKIAGNLFKCNTKTNDLSSLFLQTNTIQKKHHCAANNIARNHTYNTKPNVLQNKSFQTSTTQHNFRYPENKITRNAVRRINKGDKTNDLSFTFLQTVDDPSKNITTQHVPSKKIVTSFQISFDLNESHLKGNFSRDKILEESSFIPKFASTPKKYNKRQLDKLEISNKRHTQNCRHNSISSSRSFIKHKMTKRFQKHRTSLKSTRTLSRLEQSMNVKENNQRSISGWFFEAINESCTALVKTVKNIFKPKINLEDANQKFPSEASEKDSYACNYSFTNYMKKRDAILNNECSKKTNDAIEDFSLEMSNSCNTCNDTLALKHKLVHDENLKQTVRKLKLGINLYGCDFKRISKQLWPHQTYMTPVVLYNLYRKLIIK